MKQSISLKKDCSHFFSEVDNLQKRRPSSEMYYEKLDRILPPPCKVVTHSNVETLRAIIRKYNRKKHPKLSRSTVIDQASTEVTFTVDVPRPVSNADDSLPGSSQSSFNRFSQQSIPLEEEPPTRKKVRGSEEVTASFSTSYKEFVDLTERQR